MYLIYWGGTSLMVLLKLVWSWMGNDRATLQGKWLCIILILMTCVCCVLHFHAKVLNKYFPILPFPHPWGKSKTKKENIFFKSVPTMMDVDFLKAHLMCQSLFVFSKLRTRHICPPSIYNPEIFLNDLKHKLCVSESLVPSLWFLHQSGTLPLSVY